MATVTQNRIIWGTGRRKTAVARVRIREGTGQFLVNGLEVDDYFSSDPRPVRAPMLATEMGGRIDVFVKVGGSGKSGQAGAVVLGIARAFKEMRPTWNRPSVTAAT